MRAAGEESVSQRDGRILQKITWFCDALAQLCDLLLQRRHLLRKGR